MTPPADLVALRALVEAGDSLRYRLIVQVAGHGVDMNRRLPPSVQQAVDRWDGALPAAQEALERVGKTAWAIYKEDIAKIKTAHWLQVQALKARLARLEEWLTDIRDFCRHVPALDEPFVRADAALKGHLNSGDAEWQRVHVAAAQAARDVAHWRTRAEHAEARLAKLEGRDE